MCVRVDQRMGEAALPCWTRCVLTGALRSLLGERLEALVELRKVEGGRERARVVRVVGVGRAKQMDCPV